MYKVEVNHTQYASCAKCGAPIQPEGVFMRVAFVSRSCYDVEDVVLTLLLAFGYMCSVLHVYASAAPLALHMDICILCCMYM